MAIAVDLDVPRYLLAPEISVLLSFLPDLRQRVLIEALWNIGADGTKRLFPFIKLRTLNEAVPSYMMGFPTNYFSVDERFFAKVAIWINSARRPNESSPFASRARFMVSSILNAPV